MQMQCFSLVFGLDLSTKILKITENSSTTLQRSSISAADGQEVAELNVLTLQGMRAGEYFILLFEAVKNSVNDMVQKYPLFLGNEKPLFVWKMALVMDSIQCQLRIIIVCSTMKPLIAPLLE